MIGGKPGEHATPDMLVNVQRLVTATEDLYKNYTESFLNKDHMKKIIEEAQAT